MNSSVQTSRTHFQVKAIPVKANRKIFALYVGTGLLPLAEPQLRCQVEYRRTNHLMEAMNLLVSGYTPDAIVSEYELNGNHGLFLHAMIRSLPHLSAVPFLLITPDGNTPVVKQALEEGVQDCFPASGATPEKIAMRLHELCEMERNQNGQILQEVDRAIYRMPVSKRVFDIVMASVALLLLSPLLLLVMLAIRLESRGKVYYTSKRVGRKVFDFYKFRSMRTGSDTELEKLAREKNQYSAEKPVQELRFDLPCPACSGLPGGQTCSPLLYIDQHSICENWYGHQQREVARNKSVFIKISNDPRVTRVGRFIRNTSIDELPQLINVLKGDLSIVGNRPLPVYEAEQLTADHLSSRFLAPAGITGLWQVELRGRGGKMSEEERMRLDNEYAGYFKEGRYSFWYDMKIILRTIPALFQKAAV